MKPYGIFSFICADVVDPLQGIVPVTLLTPHLLLWEDDGHRSKQVNDEGMGRYQ